MAIRHSPASIWLTMPSSVAPPGSNDEPNWFVRYVKLCRSNIHQ